MKTIVPILTLAALVCVGCATRYDMKLSNGVIITAKGKPRVDEKKHIIFFTDGTGKTNAIPEFRVVEIAPHSSMVEDDSQKFDPTVKK